jgi:hypothetical protein
VYTEYICIPRSQIDKERNNKKKENTENKNPIEIKDRM